MDPSEEDSFSLREGELATTPRAATRGDAWGPDYWARLRLMSIRSDPHLMIPTVAMEYGTRLVRIELVTPSGAGADAFGGPKELELAHDPNDQNYK